MRVVGLDRDAQVELSKRWAAHGTRHGPLVAVDGLRKLAALLTIESRPELLEEFRTTARNVDAGYSTAATAIAVALDEAWHLEGPILDDVSDAWEQGLAAEPVLKLTVDALVRMRTATDAALAHLGQPSWNPAKPEGG